MLNRLHDGYVHRRRTRVLSEQLAPLFSGDASVLDIGCGDGLVSRLVLERRPDVTIEGIDVLARDGTHIPVRPFDGRTIPFPDRSFDATMLVDVLHHADDPLALLAEAARVSRRHVVIKDHRLAGALARPTLRFMDWIGNAHHGVVLPYNYWRPDQWTTAFATLQLNLEVHSSRLPLYPVPASWVFGRGLHFIARLGVPDRPA